jgi:hypothetical protein
MGEFNKDGQYDKKTRETSIEVEKQTGSNNPVKNWRTTTVGVIGSSVLVYVLNSLNCEIPNDWGTWCLIAIPGVVGVIMRDGKKTVKVTKTEEEKTDE